MRKRSRHNSPPATPPNEVAETDPVLAKLKDFEQGLIKPEKQALASKLPRSPFGRAISGAKIRRINDQLAELDQEANRALRESTEIIKGNRAQARYLRAFFDSSESAMDLYATEKSTITVLSREKEALRYPPNVWLETNDMTKRVIETCAGETDETNFTLFDSSVPQVQPRGLSVVNALQRLAFAAPDAMEQFAKNLVVDNEAGITSTAASYPSIGQTSLEVSFMSTPTDVWVGIAIVDNSI